eukprot:GILI01004169.1.p1 GENE.GILI01004169.1~~GILI01004169.1.p1  ORF type:complete len:255 (+),score=80.10 GILI01004169.1:43-807(+)
MSRLLIIVTLVAAAFTGASATQGWTECNSVFPDPTNLPYEVPNAVRVCRSGVLAISYDKDMIDPALSMYYVTPDQAKNLIPGRDQFYEDPDLQSMGITQAAVEDQCFNSDYNRGHLAPSHIMSGSAASKQAVYTMANIAPQGIQFNGGCWADLEGHVVNWVAANNALHIITGVSYTSRSNVRKAADGVAYPDYYFKVLCDPTTGETAGFYGVNSPATTATTDFVPVSKVEQMYGGRLFPTTLCKTSSVNQSYWW